MKPSMGKGDRLQPAVARSLPCGVQASGAHRDEEGLFAFSSEASVSWCSKDPVQLMVSGRNNSQSQPHGHFGGMAAFARR